MGNDGTGMMTAQLSVNRGIRFGALLVLVIACVLLSATFVWQARLLIEEGWWARVAPIADYPTWAAERRRSTTFGELREAVAASGFDLPATSDMASLLGIQRWLGDQVVDVGAGGNNVNSEMAWNTALSGKGLTCGGMAILFHDLAAMAGAEARVIQLYRSNFEPKDTHVIVEARIDGNWVAFDPTFNLTFHGSDGHPLGVADIRSRLASNPPRPVEITYHGDRRYPARIENYYLAGFALYANAFTHGGCQGCAIWERLPPFRYWLGPVRFMFGEAPDALVQQHNRLYFAISVVLPLLIVASGGAAFWLFLFGRKH